MGSGITTRFDGELVELSSSQVRVILHSVCHLQTPYELRVSVMYKLCNSEHPCGRQPLSTSFRFVPCIPFYWRPRRLIKKRCCRVGQACVSGAAGLAYMIIGMQIKPTTNMRIDLGFALARYKGKLPKRVIDTGGLAIKDRVTHRMELPSVVEIDAEVKEWLKMAYELDAK
jgi:hypothetical protein